jgi:hypothetical protein
MKKQQPDIYIRYIINQADTDIEYNDNSIYLQYLRFQYFSTLLFSNNLLPFEPI